MQSVQAQPRDEWLELTPAGSHDAQALDNAVYDGNVTKLVCRIGGERAFLYKEKLDNDRNGDTITFETS